MDIFCEKLRQHLEMEKYSTEIISKCYSDVSHQNEPGVYDNIEYYYMAEDNGSEAEIRSMESGNSKINTSNVTTAQLSAQIMNLPYNTFNESISNEAPKNPKKCIYDEYYIFKKIREAYAACACKICKCLNRTTISPGIQFCDCEPCKCKDCTLGNETFNRSDQIKGDFKGTTCDCKPCDCIECSLYSSPLMPDYRVVNKIREVFERAATKPCLGQSNPQQDCDPTPGTSISINKLTSCKSATCLNNANATDKAKPCRWTTPREAPSKQLETSAEDSENYSTTLKNKHPITIYHSNSNKKCVCSICECIVCECNRNALTCSLKATCYENVKAKHLGLTDSKPNFRQNRATLQSMERFECKCDICSCIQCERDSEWKNRDCNCDQCCDEVCERGCKTPGDALYPIKTQISISRENPLTYECNEYAYVTKSRAQSNLMTTEKIKYGNIYYVANDKTNESTNKILSQVQSTMTENKVDVAVHKDSDRIIKNVDSKRKLRKSTQVDNTIKVTTRRPNSRTFKNSAKDTATSNLPTYLSKKVPLSNPGKTRTHSFYPGCRSTQTHTSKSSSSLLSYQNNGCCTHTISLPDTNIADEFTRTTPESHLYEIRKNNYQKQHDIYVCCDIKNDFNKINATKLVRFHQNNNNDKKNVVENFIFDTFDKYLTKSCIVEKTEQSKLEHESVHTTLRKAKRFTLYLKKILKKYEKANSEFESVSEKLKKSKYIMVNKANNNLNCKDCGSIHSTQSACNKRKLDTNTNESFINNNRSVNSTTMHAADIEVKNNTAYKENETVVERFGIVKSPGILNHNKQKKTVRISEPKTYDALRNNAKQVEKDIRITKITKSADELQDSIKGSCNGTINRTPSIKSIITDKSHVPQDALEGHEHAFSEVQQLDHFTFNYHTKTLMRSTVPAVLSIMNSEV